ncbi:MAG TPA: hypothetical protein DCG75_17600 [Bacteroidales bacterium]|nr:hypothetical protein [Bacteroidales bacterium]
MEIIDNIDKINIKQWSEFIQNHPDGNIFQSPEMYFLYLKSEGFLPFVFVAYEDNNILGVLLAVIQKEYNSFIGIFTSRAIIWGGPLVLNNNIDVGNFILKNYNHRIKSKAIYSQFRNLFDLEYLKPACRDHKFKYEDHLNIQINLAESWDNLLDNIQKSRKRNLTKSLNKGTVLKELKSDEEIISSYNLIRETYKRIKLPFPKISFFTNLFNELYSRNYCKFFIAENNNTIIGIRIILTYKNIIHDFYAGSSNNHTDKYPNDFLIMNILDWGNRNGFTFFDFGGAGKPNIPYGVRDHKLKFGGNVVNYGRFEKIHKPFIYKASAFAFKIWKFLK